MNKKQAREFLGVEKDDEEDLVRKKYKRLARKYHPDLSGGDKEKMKELNQAYEIVMKKDYGKVDVWRDYKSWWFRQFGNDPIWGSSLKDEDEKKRLEKK